MGMAKTLVDLDEQLLEAAAAALGTTTKKATVAAALREVVASAARRRELQALTSGEWADPTELAEARTRDWAR